MPLIRTESISKTYLQGEIETAALADINLSFDAGEFTALVGPSGSGKTTLLNILGALDQPTRGEVYFDNLPLSSLKGNRLSDFRLEKVGFVFQAYNLIPVLTAFENIEYPLVLRNMHAAQRTQRVRTLAQDMGIGDLLHRFPRELSGGQQQRVAVARALIGSPVAVLADEPTANLDSQNAETLLAIMKQMSQVSGTAFLFSTHDNRVMEMASRLIKLRDGHVEGDQLKNNRAKSKKK